MQFLSILLVVLIGGTFIVSAALIPFSSERGRGWRRCLTTTASCLLVVGAAGFFGSSLSAAGGLNWLPSSFEWPVGYASGVVSTPKGVHVVPHTSSGRIQVYGANWSFRTGWQVDAGGGTFKVLRPAGGLIDVITARGQWHYVFDTDGRLVSKQTYQPKSYGSFPDEGESVVVPTPPWLWVFSSPGFSWAVLVTGMVILLSVRRVDKRKAAS
jgi:YD repeat-containing protein